MENLDKMFETGLFINDLSMHDSSRDLVLAGTQQQAELKMALDQVRLKAWQTNSMDRVCLAAIVRIAILYFVMWSGPWFNIKMQSYQYRKSHCGDKTIVRSSYLHNGNSYTDEMSSLYWIVAQVSETQLKIGHSQMKSAGVRFQMSWLDNGWTLRLGTKIVPRVNTTWAHLLIKL